MRIGEVCLLTNDVPGLASFYRQLLGVGGSSSDETHQFILTEETALTVYNDGTEKNNQNQNICLAFTVEDIDGEYEKLLSLGARIIEPPAERPWGAISMSFYDPDNNIVYLRCFSDHSPSR
ncbi:MAG: VOC family protein [Clostridia bacterium]|nr:VOC family protein [Clostridia bacterium]